MKEGIKWYRDEAIRTRVYSSPVLHDDEPQPPRPDKALWKQVTVSGGRMFPACWICISFSYDTSRASLGLHHCYPP